MDKKKFNIWDWVVIKDWDVLYNKYHKVTTLKKKYINKKHPYLKLPHMNFLYEMKNLCGKLAYIMDIHSEYFKLWFWDGKFDTGYLFTKEMFMVKTKGKLESIQKNI